MLRLLPERKPCRRDGSDFFRSSRLTNARTEGPEGVFRDDNRWASSSLTRQCVCWRLKVGFLRRACVFGFFRELRGENWFWRATIICPELGCTWRRAPGQAVDGGRPCLDGSRRPPGKPGRASLVGPCGVPLFRKEGKSMRCLKMVRICVALVAKGVLPAASCAPSRYSERARGPCSGTI